MRNLMYSCHEESLRKDKILTNRIEIKNRSKVMIDRRLSNRGKYFYSKTPR